MIKMMQKQMPFMSPLTREWMKRGKNTERSGSKKTWKDIVRKGK